MTYPGDPAVRERFQMMLRMRFQMIRIRMLRTTAQHIH